MSKRPVIALLTAMQLGMWLLVAFAMPAHAATKPEPAQDQPAKVRELLDLLADPQVQAWIKTEAAPKSGSTEAAAGAEQQLEEHFSGRIGEVRDHIAAVIAAIPALPSQFARAFENLNRERQGHFPIVVYVAVFLALGFGVEWLFLRMTARIRHWASTMPIESVAQRCTVLAASLGYRLAAVGIFGLASIGAFFIFDWPPFLREVVFQYLMAFLELRLAIVASRFLLAPPASGTETLDRVRFLPVTDAAARFWHRRLVLLAGWFSFGNATVQLLGELGFEPESRRFVAYVLGLGLLAIGFDMIWERHATADVAAAPRRRVLAWLVSAFFVILWLLWVVSALPLMWFLIVIVIIPWASAGMRRGITQLLRPPGSAEATPSLLAVTLHRGLRALLIILGALFLVEKWQIDIPALMAGDTLFTRLVSGLLSSVVIILFADFGWQLARAAIDRKLLEPAHSNDPHSEEARRQARLKTLLPILRNLLLIVLLVMVALMVLTALGVNVGPLIAGASVVGVAIGFGAQTLVRDIISGMFYLLDDAFRVGEYIQSGNFKGTVESFSLRSVKLRHHRGPVYTVPFGVLGAIQNMSRDWVIDKMSVGVTYDTDLAKVKKIVKQIGKELEEDPEFKPKILETLKMQGVEQFGDYAIQIRMKMMTKPGEQFAIRRRANAMIKQAFDANGIEFAFPTVQVAGGGEPSQAEIASAAQQVLAKPAAAAHG
ncbi:MAG TPA: mechanosensitive ion channel family protein [Stellaceae bacterium]|nr:mechanosensitive ion channel family protein [Stellaceae bacterium]